MRPPAWIAEAALIRLHDESIAEHGGLPGLRDAGLLASALARPQNLAAYGDPDLAELAAAYGFGLARNHPFVDGNKRAALLAIGLFLAMNGKVVRFNQAEAVETILSLAAGELDEGQLAAWVRRHL